MKFKEILKKIVQQTGFTVIRYPTHDQKRRILAYNNFGINTLLDVGANSGQYALIMRESGYIGTIHSFEPTSKAFKILDKKAKKDENWHVYNIAIGSTTGEVEINISQNSFSSSILEIEALHVASAPLSRYVSKEKVPIDTIDNLFQVINKGSESVYLKMDTQGYEAEVLKGAENSLSKIKCVQLEMSLAPLYKNEWLFEEMMAFLTKKNFGLYTIEPEFYNATSGQLLQADAIFYNKNI